ncbi:hypothetical protein AB6806_27365 [Bosea sp. RCC_152_1]|uniref:hypothetical protein n=1 Tax=Bosea sp. RCC_152_1 TaxID=3239228 RepID=UPI003525DC6B
MAMSLNPDIVDIGAAGWTLVLTTRSNGSGDAKIAWEAIGQHEAEFRAGLSSPAAALEVILARVERNGAVSPLDVPALVGVLVGHFQRRAR